MQILPILQRHSKSKEARTLAKSFLESNAKGEQQILHKCYLEMLLEADAEDELLEWLESLEQKQVLLGLKNYAFIH